MSIPLPSTEATIHSLDPRIQEQFRKANHAFESGKYSYSIELTSNWIRTYPNIPEIRFLLRESQLADIYPNQNYRASNSAWKSGISNLFSPGGKDARKAIDWCESKLAIDPLDLKANETLANVCEKLGWVRTQIFALQTLLTHPNRKPAHVVKLVRILIEQNETENAMRTCEAFLKAFPGNAEILEVRNQVSIAQSIEKVDS